MQGASPWIATAEETLILRTSDEQLVHKLHAMRAARSVFEYEQRRWIVTRIMRADLEPEDEESAWAVFGRRARR